MNTLYLIRGLPGSGKSTLASRLTPFSGTDCSPAFEADDYFLNENDEYCFDPRKLKEAHEDCQRKVEDAMLESDPEEPSLFNTIAVANTFSKQWEVDPYLKLAEEYGYSVFIIECQNDFGSVHDVPEKKVEAMKERWEKITT